MKLDRVASTSMDPRLQRLVERKRRGFNPAATSSTDRGEIAVIAKVKDPAAWEAMSEVRSPNRISSYGEGSAIVTGRIPLSRLEAIRTTPGVISLKLAQPLRPMLAATLADVQARPDLLPTPLRSAPGKGVIVGIVDLGCDFAHANFRKSSGQTRLLALWDQSAPARPESPFGYGRAYDAASINAALQQDDPYTHLGYRPGPEAHGTHVMDIAAGSGGGTGVAGVAPQADLVFVEIAASDVPWGGEEVVGRSFGDSVQLLEAVRFIFDRAGDTPCAINISLGTNGGPHDGSSLVEQGIDLMVSEKPGRAVVIAASNSFADGIHAAGTVAQGGTTDLPWEIAESDSTDNELELWYGKDDELVVEVLEPGGASMGSVELGQSARAQDAQGNTVLFIAHRKQDPNNGDNVVGMFLNRAAPAGRWTLRLHGKQVTAGGFHAWIERDDPGQSTFVAPLDNSHTLGSISCSRQTIVVGSYDAHRPARPLSWFSSAGPTRDGRLKPEISAPGHEVWAALSESGDESTRMSGTSMAAPAVTGVVALMYSAARSAGVSLSSADTRAILAATARKAAGAAWDPRYGEGRIDALAAVQAVLARAGVVPLASATGALAERRKSPRAAGGKARRQPAATLSRRKN
jgi:subtilisin family serine protease